jgi:hypothetical protein
MTTTDAPEPKAAELEPEPKTAPEPKSMADRHRDEIQGIIDYCEDRIAPHKEIAFWREETGKPKPLGYNAATLAVATQAIVKERAACSKAIAEACKRHRGEANA